jgi:hypothetical protein
MNALVKLIIKHLFGEGLNEWTATEWGLRVQTAIDEWFASAPMDRETMMRRLAATVMTLDALSDGAVPDMTPGSEHRRAYRLESEAVYQALGLLEKEE